MNLNIDFRTYCTRYFSRLVGGYFRSLDSTSVRAWIDGHLNPADQGGAWDATTRMFPALCSWLGSGRSPVVTSAGAPIDIAAHVRAVLANAFDPANPGYWGAMTPRPGVEPFPGHQHTVEGASLAFGAWLVRNAILRDKPDDRIAHFRKWLEYFGRCNHLGNWQLFVIVNQAARKALGWPFDKADLDKGWKIINSLEREDGYMTDGGECHYDDYNWWVFGTHELMWLEMDGQSDPALAEKIRQRTRRRMEDFPYYFASDGGYTEYGRSLSYKFARLGLPLMAYRHGLWPHSAGMLQRLVRRHLAWYDNRGAIDRHTDLVRQELTRHGHPDVRDGYINTGHPYWCMLAFAGLWQIPDSDPIWTAEEDPLPAERETFTRVIKPAGWVLANNQETGHVIRYAIGSKHGDIDYPLYQSKYNKFAYSTHFPINIATVEGDVGPDSALCLTDAPPDRGVGAGLYWSHMKTYDRFIATGDYLRATHRYRVGEHEVPCDTILVPRGEFLLRIHRLDSPATLYAIEGANPLGMSSGHSAGRQVDTQTCTSQASFYKMVSLIRGIRGYDRALRPQAFRHNERVNLLHYRAIAPMIAATLTPGKNVLVCLTVAMVSGPPTIPQIAVDVGDDGRVKVTWDGKSLSVPPL